jgi:protein-disulfide isomerase
VRATGGRTRQASSRVLIAAGAALAGIVVAIVVGIVLTRGSSSDNTANVPAVGSIASGLPEAGVVDKVFGGIPQNGTTLGSAKAPVTMTVFIDLQCPYCRAFETELFPNVVTRYVRTGKLKVVMQPWAFIGPDSVRGQAAVLAAAKQNRAFNFAALLYYNQKTENTGWLDDAMISAAAASIPGLRVHSLLAERDSARVKASAAQVADAATARKVHGTPTIFVGKSGTRGELVSLRSPADQQTLVQAIERALG